jgi:hypothetical protein
VAAAFMARSNRRKAGRVAFIAALASWSFFIQAMVTEARIRASDQEPTVSIFLWKPSPSPLTIREPENATPSKIDIQRIRDAKITGTISLFNINRFGSGTRSSVVLIMQRPVARRVELPEPDAANVVYVQEAAGWKMFPAGAHILQRKIRIDPIPGLARESSLSVELADGSGEGFGVWWPKEEFAKPGTGPVINMTSSGDPDAIGLAQLSMILLLVTTLYAFVQGFVRRSQSERPVTDTGEGK